MIKRWPWHIDVISLEDCKLDGGTYGLIHAYKNTLYRAELHVLDPYYINIIIYNMEGEFLGYGINTNFVTLAEFREIRINAILND